MMSTEAEGERDGGREGHSGVKEGGLSHAGAARKFGAQCAEARMGHSQVGPSAITSLRVRNHNFLL